MLVMERLLLAEASMPNWDNIPFIAKVKRQRNEPLCFGTSLCQHAASFVCLSCYQLDCHFDKPVQRYARNAEERCNRGIPPRVMPKRPPKRPAPSSTASSPIDAKRSHQQPASTPKPGDAASGSLVMSRSAPHPNQLQSRVPCPQTGPSTTGLLFNMAPSFINTQGRV